MTDRPGLAAAVEAALGPRRWTASTAPHPAHEAIAAYVVAQVAKQAAALDRACEAALILTDLARWSHLQVVDQDGLGRAVACSLTPLR